MNNSTDLVFLFSPLSSFSETGLRSNQISKSDMSNILPSAEKHFEVSNRIPTVRSNFKKLPVLLFSSLFFVPVVNASTYYVATNGSDTNPGTLSSPWRTINKAANTLVAGDSVNIRAGTYKEQVTPKNSGNASSGFITYAAYPNETVTVDASNGLNAAWSGVFNISNRSYIQISGLRIINSPGFGVFLSSSNNMRILNNYISNISNAGILVDHSDTITLDGNEVGFASSGGDQNNGIQESVSLNHATNYIVSNNSVHDGGMEGIDAKVGSSNGKIFGNTVYNMARVGIYVDAWDTSITNVEIYKNTVSNSRPVASGAAEDGIRIGAEHGSTVSNVKIYNNTLHNLSGSGVTLANYTESGYPEPKFSNISMYNNTIYNAGTKAGNSWGGGGIDVQTSSNTGITIRNNILSKAGSFNVAASSGSTVSNNLFDAGSTSGTSAVQGNPAFMNVAKADFHLQATSPAINTGITTGAPTVDFDQQARPQGGQVDIGAFEYGSSASSPSPTSPSPTIDVTAPSVPVNLAATAPDSTKVYLSWNASTDNVGVTGYIIYRNGTQIGTSAVASFTDSAVVGGTTYNYTAKASDVASNLSASSNTATVNTPQATTSAVKISSYSAGNITANSSKINWTTNVPSTGVVSYGTSATNLSSKVNAGNMATRQAVQINGLARGTTYYYKISASNGSVTSSFRTSRW